MAYTYDFKVVVSGKQVEVFKYKKNIWREYDSPKDEQVKKPKQLNIFEQQKLKEQQIKSSINRTKTELRRLINSNPGLNKFMTLTFAKSTTDIAQANYIFNQFIKRISYRYPDFQYIAVPEFQKDTDFYGRKKENGGSVHYHLLCNLPYIEMSALEWLWGQGMVNIRETGQVNNLGAYMCKYLGKELFTGRMFGKKKYFRSQSLSESVELIGWYAMKFVEKFLSLISPVFEKTFYSEWVGMVDYKAFTLGFVPFKNGYERSIIFNSA
ncbi:hypothetical protein A2303_02050 [Candidatus Falkowbacteria bacterium RIFOXYB2_FULL_47_14]|uniref:Replication-associated protein ORF2/G2P domain-containing protein n=1 Tax=Candidatus Falkowbacteria bacterium RIFOXYA2_FULL_47_19 TaxID=1797994 RepID=A0A1F5SEI0_9BACT|nr:MAG: hypothetical protein A2227_07230 [Candidatus Falkowbacteria bacterium RIFOXYA2_FULL_47_19]OGF35212.1 MAG: hypothetical protein A2468_00855 [Candidatus Falkowbacteria bacterium RIFOXYC2_FULL_46_15]OGF43851.1 MAG: hypothetical protein A2303_02050 [Candidatus Falkowbacteria bacterium RIFOXYB2_FULL_47_14]